tara:strand:+ start:5910 stop:10547 length:4638 start_codon:yes stop_codon:yes gene_type:complete
MSKCKLQEEVIVKMIDSQVEVAKRILSNKNYFEAERKVKLMNEQSFLGNSVIRVKKSGFSDAEIEVYKTSDETVLNKYIQDRVDRDAKIQEQQDTKDRIEELKQGNNYYFDDMLPAQGGNSYNEYSYVDVLSRKMLFKEKLERQISLLKNKDSSKETLKQIQELKSLNNRLYLDIESLQKEEALSEYLNSVQKDIRNVKDLLKNPTLENIQTINNYIDILDKMTSTESDSFLGSYEVEVENEESKTVMMSLTTLKKIDPKAWEHLSKIHEEVSLLKNEVNTKITKTLKTLILDHIKQKDKYKDYDKRQLDLEVERLYDNQISQTLSKNTGVYTNPKAVVEGQVSYLKSRFVMLDNQEEKNVFVSAIYKMYADALSMNNKKESREKLSILKNEVERIVKNLGFTKGVGFFKKADLNSIFTRKSANSYQLIGKFSESWVSFKKISARTQNEVSKILYKPDKTQIEKDLIQKQFDDINENADFLDISRIPEITLNEEGEFEAYKAAFLSEQEAIDYKAELIGKIGEREYNKIVKEQIEKIYAYQAFREVKEARLREKFDIPANQDVSEVLSETEFNKHLNYLYSKSPFIFAENYRTKGTNKIAKPYFIKGEKQTDENTIADLEYISYFPKQDKHFDPNFKTVQDNKVLKEAWGHMADLVEYNNENGFNHNPDNLTEYSLASQDKRVKYFPMRMLGMLSGKTLKNIHEALNTNQYKNPNLNYNIAGEITNVDQEIARIVKFKIKELENPTGAEIYKIEEETKKLVLNHQNEDLIENILASTEITEKFKAKREIENRINFLSKALNQTERKHFKELVDFFKNKELYQVDNRANWNSLGKSFALSDYKSLSFTKFYNAKTKEVRKIVKDVIKSLEERLDSSTDEQKAEMLSDIASMNAFLDSGGKVMTPGSLIEAVIIKLARVAAFSLNFSAQIKNAVIANINAWEVDGKLGFWDPGAYHDALSFSRSWKRVGGTTKMKNEIRTGDALLQRLGVFQNSANEIFQVQNSRASNSFKAIMESPINLVGEVEKMIQRPQIFALIAQINVQGENGTVPMFDPVSRSFPAFEVDERGILKLKKEFNSSKNRATYLTNTSQEYADNFGDAGKIPAKIAFINGDYRGTSTYLFESTTLGAMTMLFKRWSVKTLEKKFGVVKRLGENEHSGLGTLALGMKAGTFALATGTLFGPVGLGSVLALYATYHGVKTVRNSLKNDTNHVANAMTATMNVSASGVGRGTLQAIRLSLAVAAQSLSMIIDPISKRQLVNSAHIKKIIGLKDKRADGQNFTPDQIREVQEDLYFLTTSIAATLKFLALRYLVMIALSPEDEEKRLFGEKVLAPRDNIIAFDGIKPSLNLKNTFWDRLAGDPDTAMYYMLENMYSGFIDDSNMLVNPEGLVRGGDIFGVSRFGVIGDDLYKIAKGESELKSGVDQGKNRAAIHLLRFYTPSVLKGGLSLGFDASSRRDYTPDTYIDRLGETLTDKLRRVNKKRLAARKKHKKALKESAFFNNLTETGRAREINKYLSTKYPVIKNINFTSEGKLKKADLKMYKHYIKD